MAKNQIENELAHRERTEHLMFNKMIRNLGTIKRFAMRFDFKTHVKEKNISISADVTPNNNKNNKEETRNKKVA